ncbi:GNAT family N-acetyltransferase [Frankia sp. AgPm24]|uniref:GNAT family N-acetyltransferase n=1 Tax=Frankia sp. AgPm24 TaxID=631128 RepID=UPI00200F65DD|nr:GNAT family N-acetyltransferase [Frankia sp. AgPm24]MCK9923920.1 GNAT family N-acetyltransferase [Frankia sp. AgPm24]
MTDPSQRPGPVRPAGQAGPNIQLYEGDRRELRALFELAEDSAVQLAAYLSLGRVLVARIGTDLVGHLQVVPTEYPDHPDHPVQPGSSEGRTPEIRNMAVLTAYQGRGVGRALIAALVDLLVGEGATSLLVATGAADVGNLRFYQRCGFRFRSVERDAFTAATGYPPGLVVDGIELRDRVWLDLDLPARPPRTGRRAR